MMAPGAGPVAADSHSTCFRTDSYPIETAAALGAWREEDAAFLRPEPAIEGAS